MHGLEYRSEPFMDGVAGLTQCAIAPNHTFLYDFSVQDYPGTYWYHPHTDLSHLSSIDSMKGVLIVHPPLGSNELHHDLYDEEMVLFYTDWWHQSQHELYMGRLGGQLGPVTTDADGIRVGTFPYQGMLLNGRGGAAVAPLAMQPGSRYRLRVINGGWVFPIEFSVDGHALLVIQTDGADTEPLEVDSIQISNGERYDVVLVRRSEACASRTSFWVRAAALGAMPQGGLSTALHLGEAGPPEECPHQNPKTLNCVWDRSRPRSGCLLLTALRRHARAGETYGWDHGAAGQGDIVMHTIDARFTSPPNFGHFVKLDGADRTGDAWTADEFFSGQWVQGALPNLPPMIHGEDHLTPATVTLTAVSGTIVELLLRNVDKYAHPWHMHGHKFVVMEQAAVDFASCSIMYCFEGIPGNSRSSAAHAQTAVLKDTVTIPAGGWLRLRFQADNPGWWIFHCHIHMHLSDGMGLVIYEPGPVGYEFPEPPSDLLTCAPSPEPTTCTCFEDSDAVMGTSPLSSYTCSRKWLCAGDSSLFLGLPSTTQSRSRDLAAGRAWRYSVAVVWLLLLLFGGIIQGEYGISCSSRVVQNWRSTKGRRSMRTNMGKRSKRSWTSRQRQPSLGGTSA
ncbi:unnamed protein product [Prorocentrum cordatum]|uniref:Uncharacterized protein n=1 Tax=Prorocentrum cordatum TaxID=2364126 RepID=A0ABN9RA74_9DINO|nr:unnamed protein product [Polarella glacialis]